jgi:hypothetical protein
MANAQGWGPWKQSTSTAALTLYTHRWHSLPPLAQRLGRWPVGPHHALDSTHTTHNVMTVRGRSSKPMAQIRRNLPEQAAQLMRWRCKC